MIKPFHQWKQGVVRKESDASGVYLYLRPKEWYYSEYGAYVSNSRKAKNQEDKAHPNPLEKIK